MKTKNFQAGKAQSKMLLAWAQDGKVLSQWKEVPLQECPDCHHMSDTRMELVDHETGKCEKCVKAAQK